MRIQDSSVNLSATHEASSSRHVEIDTELGFRQVFASLATPREEDAAGLRERVRKMLESLVEAIMAAIDGRPCQEKLAGGSPLAEPETAEKGAPASDRPAEPVRGRLISWQSVARETVHESESTRVAALGCVRTADGRTIDFACKVDLQREYTRHSEVAQSGEILLRDPLVLSFDGQSCELTETRIAFDLDADGKPEQIPGLAGGSCFLVFDRNGNGKADDGSELFGVASGDGFADLAKLDGDGNGWIDEGDAAFAQLRLWSGEDFRGLATAGVGALYTGAVDAPFSLRGADNALLGQIRAAGVYLMESGQAGLLQHVDLAVSASPAEEQPEQGQQLAA